MEHKIPSDFKATCQVDVSPARAGWRYLEFCVMAYGAGDEIHGMTGDNEVCMVFLSGDATVKAAGQSWTVVGRKDVFAGLPHALYLPPDARYTLALPSAAEVAFGRAPAAGKLAPRLITPGDITVEIRGGHNVTRQISHILDPGDAEKLLCVEVYTPSGNWSSYPPHRHDAQHPPADVYLEEVYYYRMDPSDGWAMQRLYTDDRSLDEVVLASHGDAVLVRRGYHPVVAAPGYDLYYLNFLAGEMPSWVAKDEPQLAWVRGNWAGKEDRLRLPLKGTRR